MVQQNALQGIMDTIEGTTYSDVQSIDRLMEYGFKLQQWIAFSGSQMSVCRETLHAHRKQAMINLMASMAANNVQLSASLQKDYINDLCGPQNAVYELATRCNSACIHNLDFIRSCISALKEERKQNY